MFKLLRRNLMILLVFVFATCTACPGYVLAQGSEPVSPKLTPRLQDLLAQEMRTINAASHEILSALVIGNDERVAVLSQQIHDSFILRQSMTPNDKRDLKAAVPDEFLQMDRDFHVIAAELAKAARAKDRPLQQMRFTKMIKACIACHAKYATNRFPGSAK